MKGIRDMFGSVRNAILFAIIAVFALMLMAFCLGGVQPGERMSASDYWHEHGRWPDGWDANGNKIKNP